MRLNGRRESSNVEDRRGMSGGMKAGIGIGGIIMAVVFALMSGGDLSTVLPTVLEQATQPAQQQQGEYKPTAEEQKFEKSVSNEI